MLYRDLFPTPGPESDTEKLDIKLDRTMGGNRDVPQSTSPDDSAFGFYIMSGRGFFNVLKGSVSQYCAGPEDDITSINKRDGSHWELFGCDNTIGEQRQTVKAVCTDSSNSSNYGNIFKGKGVPTTILDMPEDCGPGRYAVAVSMKPSKSHAHLYHHLVKRGLRDTSVWDLTFDYDYTVFEKRADPSKVLVRIDYSDDPGYWSNVVGKSMERRAMSLY